MRRLDLTTLYKRRIRGDLIQMYKFENNIDEINWCNDIVPVLSLDAEGQEAVIRGHSERLRTVKQTKSNKCSLRFNYFTNRVLPHWNSLPEYVIKAPQRQYFQEQIKWIGKNLDLNLLFSEKTFYLVTTETWLKYAGSRTIKTPTNYNFCRSSKRPYLCFLIKRLITSFHKI